MAPDRASLPDTLGQITCDLCRERYATSEPPAPGSVYGVRCEACGQYIVPHGVKLDPLPPARPWSSASFLWGRRLPAGRAPPAPLPADLRTAIENATGAPAEMPTVPDPGGAELGAGPSGQAAEPVPASPADRPAAGESAAPEFMEPPAGVRATSLSPEQVDALLEQYLGQPSPLRTVARPIAPPVRVPMARRRTFLRRLGRSPPSILAVAILPALLAGAGVYAYLGHLAGERSGIAVRQPGVPPSPVPATAPATAAPPASTAGATSFTTSAASRDSAPVRAATITMPVARGVASPRETARGTAPRAEEPGPPVGPIRAPTVTVPVAHGAVDRRQTAGATAPAPTEERESPRQERTAVAAAPAPATPQIPAPLAEPPEEAQRPRLTPAEVAAVIGSYRETFEACAADWLAPQAALSGLKVDLLIAVEPNGAVTWAALGDRAIERSRLGGCLVDAGRKMAFPRFGGGPLQVRIPLVLGQGTR